MPQRQTLSAESVRGWLVGYGGLAVVSYLLAATGLRAIIVTVDFLIALAATYVLFPEAVAGFQELTKGGASNGA